MSAKEVHWLAKELGVITHDEPTTKQLLKRIKDTVID